MKVAAVLVVALALLVAISGSGGGNDEVVHQQELRAERAEAARIARQGERIRQLERRMARGDARTADSIAQASPPPVKSSSPNTGMNDSWPAGVDGWTVVLGSSSNRSAAEDIATAALSAGLPQVGILFSSNYSSLNDGYWVTYTGVLGSKSEAVDRQEQGRVSGFSDAYARKVSE